VICVFTRFHCQAFTSKTRLLILNTPHNPTGIFSVVTWLIKVCSETVLSGKMFSVAELEKIAAIVKENPNVVCLADEVYEVRRLRVALGMPLHSLTPSAPHL